MPTIFTKRLDQASLLVIVITLLLFILALFSQGFTHALFLETAVFLVSVKLILSSHRDGVFASEMKTRLDSLDAAVQRIANQMPASLEREPTNDQQLNGSNT